MENKKLDILFIHPPASTNKANHTLDADVGYTGQFVALPMGFFNMSDKLDKVGYKVKILNLGERVHTNKKRSVSAHIKCLISDYSPKIIGMDIHWMIHQQGLLNVPG